MKFSSNPYKTYRITIKYREMQTLLSQCKCFNKKEFRVSEVTSTQFSVQKWDHVQTNRLFMGNRMIYNFYIVPLRVLEIEVLIKGCSFSKLLQFARYHSNSHIFCILLLIFVKQSTYYRTRDTEENGPQVNWFATRCQFVRSDVSQSF